MNAISRLINSLAAFELQIPELVQQALWESEGEVLSLNKERLFEEGTDRNDDFIEPEYRPFTIEVKEMTGLPTDHVTLFQTGGFYASFFIEYGADGFSIQAKDPVSKKLYVKYGGAVMGLTDDEVAYVSREFVAPYVLQHARKLFL